MSTTTRNDFCRAMEVIYQNHGVYIATGNGEYTESLTIRNIHQMEMAYGVNVASNTSRVLAYIANCYKLGYDMSKSRAGDCSGIIVGCLRDLALIKPTADYRAKDFQKMCTPVSLKNLKAGDLVFDKPSNASHVGVYVGNNNVIESQGRDKGVVKRPLSAGSWAAGGSFTWWAEDKKVEYYKKYTGTTTSIVTALHAVGEKDTSFEHRQRIAVANKFVSTVQEWKGRAAQNILMLDTLKKGVLIKCL